MNTQIQHHEGYNSRCTKKKYHSLKTARKAMKRQARWIHVKRVYFCTECKAYHLTSLGIDWHSKSCKMQYAVA